MRVVAAVLLLLALAMRPTGAAPAASPSPAPAPATKKPAGPSPGTPSTWGIPPELRPKDAQGLLWYVQPIGAQSGLSLDPRIDARNVAFSQLIPLRSDREALGTRFVTPTGGDPTDGITANSFSLNRGDAATTSILFGVALPMGASDTLSLDSSLYMRSGDPRLARDFGATQPWGAFVDHSPSGLFDMPTLEPQLHRVTWVREGANHKMRAVVGDFVPIVWSPVDGATQRNRIDLSHLTYRPFQANVTVLAFGTIYPLDRQFGPPRVDSRGADYWLRSGDFEVEVLSARQETHPAEPFSGHRFRQAVGGRVGVTKPRWGLGLSGFNMYGDNLVTSGDPRSGNTAAGRELLWSVDGSIKVTNDLTAYGAYASTRFHHRGITFTSQSDALVGGLFLEVPPTRSELRLQYQTLGPNYEALNVRNQVMYPANYHIWTGELRQPFPGGQVFLSARHSGQIHPDVVSGATYAVNDAAFPSNAGNQGRGNILDWLAQAEYEIPSTPCKVFLSWQEVAFNRGATPGLANSATHRTVGQQSAMLRIQATPQLAVHVGLGHFQCGGTIGTFTRTVQFKESQTIPRLGLTWSPDPDTSLYLMLQKFHYTDGLAVSRGLNNYDASQFILEIQSRLGGGFQRVK